ncbi:hypothetical protein ACQKMV_22625 [Lysinibacillus sp. NPDC094403]|uniref:hypothetical protein n=1 Tax=Lysinibacillus sp. NPDC094403 TaxID=3390581 RepID=UPI003D005CD0
MVATSIAFFQGLFFSSIRLTGVAIEIIVIGSAPVLSGALEWVLLKSQPTKVWGIASVMAIRY